MNAKIRLFGTLLTYEIKKIMKNRFAVIALIILTIYSLIQGVFQAEQTGEYAARTREAKRAIDGRMIDDTLLGEMAASSDEYGTLWNESNCTYEALADWVRKIVDYGKPLAAYDSAAVYGERLSSMEEAMNLLMLKEGEKEYWRSQGEFTEEPLIWHSTDEALGLIDILSATPMIMLFMITLLLSQIFAGEVKDRTDPLLRCTRGGRGITYGAKITAAMILIFFITVLSDALSILESILLWGTNGWDAAVQVILPMSPYPMTMGRLFTTLALVALISSLFLSVITCFLSECLKNPVAVMGTVFGGFLVILALARQVPERLRALSQLLYLLSPVDMNSTRGLYEFRLIGWNGHYLTAWQFLPMLYGTLSVILILAGYFHYLKRGKD